MQQSPHRPALLSDQYGLSLIELMIAIFLGMLLIGSAFSMLTGLTQSGRVQSGLTQIQNDARYVMDVFTRETRKAGFRSDITKSTAESFPADKESGFGRGIFLTGDQSSLSFRFYGSGAEVSGPEGNIRDCLGNAAFNGEMVVQRFFLRNGNLICERHFTPQRIEAIELTSGIKKLQFVYGIETDGDGYADLYKPVPAAADSVVSVRMDIELEAQNLLLDTPDENNQRVSEQEKTLTREYSQLVSLRNIVR